MMVSLWVEKMDMEGLHMGQLKKLMDEHVYPVLYMSEPQSLNILVYLQIITPGSRKDTMPLLGPRWANQLKVS
jgi:hypothetical protein